MQLVEEAVFQARQEHSLNYSTQGGPLTVEVCDPRIVRVRLGIGSALSYLPPNHWTGGDFELRQGEPATLTTEHLSASVAAKPLRLAFAGAQGRALPSDARLFAADPEGRIRVSFAIPQGHHFYGLGHGGQGLDRLGGARQLWNAHVGRGPGSDISIPLIVSNRGYALFFDNPADAVLTIGRSEEDLRLVYEAQGGSIDFYVLAAAGPREVMGAVADLLGHATMPPRWYLGYLQSTRHFDSTEELRGLARQLRSRRIPCDGLIFLSTYGEALGWNRMVGHLEFEPTLWKDARGLIAEMREQHFEVMTHEYPVLHRDSPLFAEASRKGYLLDEGYPEAAVPRPPAAYREGQRYIDFSNPDARRWWWEQHRGLRDVGVAGWWLDGGEGPPATARLAAGPGTLVHNVYDLFRQQAFAEGEAADRPDLRPVLLCRSGAAGMQRYGGTCWSGDVDNTFATLAAQIPLGLNTGVSGVPWWGTDIGGFFHPVSESSELYARWYQFGAFCPIFRSHGQVWREHTPWAHGPAVEDACRKVTELRYRLLPYTYTLAWQAASQGLPLMRPLWLNYPDDPHVWERGFEYLWGDDLLVAPVTRDRARRWSVYLPAGAWFDYWTQQRHEGGRSVEVDAPLDQIPLFVREGAIVAMGPLVQYVDERPLEAVTLVIHPGPESRFALYDDEGRTNAWRRGEYALTEVRCRAADGRVTVSIEAPRGDARVIPAGREYTLQIRMAGVSRVDVEVDGGTRRLEQASRGHVRGWWAEDGWVFVRVPGGAAAVSLRP